MSKDCRIEFLIIDPQNDFCVPGSSLYVPGADEDSIRLANTIKRLSNRLDDIHVTLDTHHLVDIAHPIFWLDKNGKHPNPFTIITFDDLRKGAWRTTNPAYMSRKTMESAGWPRNGAFEYLEELEINNRYPLCIWPPHCLIGSWGHNVVNPVSEALNEWESQFAMVDYVTKGSNFWTEHYSAVQADVPDTEDPGTMLNTNLIELLEETDVLALSGQALSHCVANTVIDIANNFGEENIKKMTLLIDTSSSVPGFEKMGQDFVDKMTKRGMNISKAEDFLK